MKRIFGILLACIILMVSSVTASASVPIILISSSYVVADIGTSSTVTKSNDLEKAYSDSFNNSYMETDIPIYYVGYCSSDIGAIGAVGNLLKSEEDDKKELEQQFSSYSDDYITYYNFYAVLDAAPDDDLFMEKMANNEVELRRYSDIVFGDKMVTVTVVRYK